MSVKQASGIAVMRIIQGEGITKPIHVFSDISRRIPADLSTADITAFAGISLGVFETAYDDDPSGYLFRIGNGEIEAVSDLESGIIRLPLSTTLLDQTQSFYVLIHVDMGETAFKKLIFKVEVAYHDAN